MDDGCHNNREPLRCPAKKGFGVAPASKGGAKKGGKGVIKVDGEQSVDKVSSH